MSARRRSSRPWTGSRPSIPVLPVAILLDGDTLENGNVVARRSRGAVDFAMFSALAKRAPTIINLGNHETEFYDLAETVARIEATGAQVVTNLTNRDTGRPAAPPSVRLRLGANETVVIGVATDDVSTYREAVRPSLSVADPVTWARANFPALLGARAGENRPEPRRTECRSRQCCRSCPTARCSPARTIICGSCKPSAAPSMSIPARGTPS